MSIRVLLVEDHEPTRRELAISLAGAGCEVVVAENGADALQKLEGSRPDVVISDYRMSPVDGLDLLRRVRSRLDVPIILYSAGADAEAIFRAGRDGAVVFLEYPFRIEDQLLPTMERCLAATRQPRAERKGRYRLVGPSVAMHRVRSFIRRIAPTPTSVLLIGETGVGKELAARAIHEESGRRHLVSVSVMELSDSLLESELFGHTRGAFTGAVCERSGLFERADGGTLFLDEIGDASPSLQGTLLRALESGEIRRIGSFRTRKVDVRLVAATNRELGAMVRAGAFREDLYYRIRATELRLPPLRERLEDLPELVAELLVELAERLRVPVPEPSPEFIRSLAKHAWPGNVRELRTALQSALLWWDGRSHLGPEQLLDALSLLGPGLSSEELAMRSLMIETLRRCGGNQEAARREIGLSRGEWRHRWSRYGLEILGRRRT